MISPLFFYQLTLIALVWLCVMLQWAWPSDSAACPTPLVPPPPRPSVTVRLNSLRASPQSRPATPVRTPPLPTCEPRQFRPHASCSNEGAAATSIPRCTYARTPIVPIGAGSAGGISAPMVIPMAVPGDSYCVSSVSAISGDPRHPLPWQAHLR